jgi:hypothetical protein
MRILVALPLLLALIAAGCGATETEEHRQPESRSASSGAVEPHACGPEAGAITDVAGEPDWRRWADYRPWTDATGCLVRIDVLADRPGPAHCRYQSARVIITGKPVGTSYAGPGNSAEYVRDPNNVFGDRPTAGAFDPDAELPKGAVDTGFREGSTELWIDPPDGSVIYLVSEGSVERWPLDPDPTLCE